MTIDSNGPRRLIFDVYALTDTIDRDAIFSPLAWQYVVERDMVTFGHLTVASTLPDCPSLSDQHRLIRAMQKREGINVIDLLGTFALEYLKNYVVSVEMTSTELVVTRLKLLTGASA